MNKQFKAMSVEQVLATLKRSLVKRRAKLEREAKDVLVNPKKYHCDPGADAQNHSEYILKDASELAEFIIGSFTYMPRLEIFRDRDGFEYNPVLGEGDSHFALVINGVMHVDGYVYQTLFKALGIPFVVLNAPSGLDALNSSVKQLAFDYGTEIVAAKYGQGDQKYRLRSAKRTVADIEKLRKAGATVPKGILEKAVADAEKTRTNRLEAAAQHRARSAQWALMRAQAKGDLREVIKATNKVERLKAKLGAKAA